MKLTIGRVRVRVSLETRPIKVRILIGLVSRLSHNCSVNVGTEKEQKRRKRPMVGLRLYMQNTEGLLVFSYIIRNLSKHASIVLKLHGS